MTYAMIVGLNPEEMEVLKRNLITTNTSMHAGRYRRGTQAATT